MTDEPLAIDNSTLRAVARCSTEAMVRYAWHWTTAEERATLKAGTAFHTAMERHFKGDQPAEVLAAFSAGYDAWADENVKADDRLAPANLSRIVSRWLDLNPLATSPFTVDPTMVEVGFAYPLTDDGSIVFCGRLDGVAQYQDALYVLEHKSTGRITQDWLDTFTLDSQLSGYIWAAQQHTGMTVVGAFLNAIEFSKLPNSAMKCKGGGGVPSHGVPYSECGHLHANMRMAVVSRAPEALVEWKKTATHLAIRYRDMLAKWPTLESLHKLRMQGTFNGSCRFCSFKDFCKLHRPMSYIAAGNLIFEKWSPYERATLTNEPTAHTP